MIRCFFLLALALLTLPVSAATDGWVPVATMMQDGRWAPSASLLAGGHQALIAGGFSYSTGGCVASADRFDAQTRRFIPCRGRLLYPRDFATATLLPDRAVLVAGGFNTVLGTLDTAELYDPIADGFRLLDSRLSSGRELFTATSLTDGRVLIVGGFDTRRRCTQASADLFDPKSQAFQPTGSLAQDRFGQAAVRLADGRVLVVGGKHWQVGHPDVPLASAEIYDSASGRFHRTTGDMAAPRDRPTATLLPDGTVLIAGGQNGADGTTVAEVFDPVTERFHPLTSLLTLPRMAHSDVTLPDGRVLLAGGWCPPLHATTASTELFDPQTGIFMPGPPMPQSGHDIALLVFADGLVLAAGGKQVEKAHESSVVGGAYWLVPVK
jgi:hypothetical protein